MKEARITVTGNRTVNGILRKIVESAIDAVEPCTLFENGFRIDGDKLEAFGHDIHLHQVKRIKSVAIGKSAEAMAYEIEKRLDDRVSGIVASPVEKHFPLKRFEFFKTGHPFPNEESVNAARQIRKFVSSGRSGDLLIFLISGGGSAATFHPIPGLSLEDVNKTLKILFDNGVPMTKINLVRRHLSMLSGGKLAELSPDSENISLIISDVVGDELSSIASGPTVIDTTTPADARTFLEESRLIDKIPTSVPKVLSSSARKFAKIDFETNFVKIIGSNAKALKAAAAAGVDNGFDSLVLTRTIDMNTQCVADLLVSVAMSATLDGRQVPALILLGGEPTVKIGGRGIGGRNQQLVLETLRQAIELDVKGEYFKRTTFFSFGTDGKDGNSGAAGACASLETLKSVKGGAEVFEQYISNNDSYSFFKKFGGHITTGPTDTNVMDIMGIIIE